MHPERERQLLEEVVLLKQELAAMREAMHHLTIALVRQDDAFASRVERHEHDNARWSALDLDVERVFSREQPAHSSHVPLVTRAHRARSTLEVTKRCRAQTGAAQPERDDSDVDTGPIPIHTRDIMRDG